MSLSKIESCIQCVTCLNVREAKAGGVYEIYANVCKIFIFFPHMKVAHCLEGT